MPLPVADIAERRRTSGAATRDAFAGWYRALAGRGPAYERLLTSALGPGQNVGQQGFATAADILQLGASIGARPGRRILDICCGPTGPSALLAGRLGCSVVGVDLSLGALRLAGSPGRVTRVAADAVHLPFGAATFDAALVLESLASIPSPLALFRELRHVLRSSGRIALTAEVGAPLRAHETAGRGSLSRAHVIPASRLVAALHAARFTPLLVQDRTDDQAQVARRFADGLVRAAPELVTELGGAMWAELSATMGGWADLLERRRVRKLLLVAGVDQREP